MLQRTKRSNRTIVGLKLSRISKTHLNEDLQQSHHCGIETNQDRAADLANHGQQSHHCGIETYTLGYEPSYVKCSNRTIVGLKPSIAGATALIIVSQQSHHCGIETAEKPSQLSNL